VWASAEEVAALVRGGDASPVELVDAVLERIAALNPALRAFLTVCGSRARAEAATAERTLRRGGEIPPLLGVPVSVKDLEPTAGIRTTFGSPLFADHVPSHDSVAVERLRRAGAIIVGKTNTPEFGLLGETRNLLGGECRNPWDLTRTCGGSSGGAASAIGAGLGPLALGSDGAGSVVAPAALCGVVGMKATRGRVPFGPQEPQSSLYTDVGALGRTVSDVALMLDALAGPDPRDPLSGLPAGPPMRAACELGVTGMRIAFTRDLGHFAVDPEVAGAVESAASALAGDAAAVVEAAPDIPDPWPIYEPLFWADTWATLGDLVEGSPAAFLPDARDEVLPGRAVTQVDVVRSLGALWRFRWQVAAFFRDHDALLMPAVAATAFPIGRPPDRIGGRAVRPHWSTFMPFPVVWNMCGLPEVSVPRGRSGDGLPLGVLVVAPWGREDVALRVAGALQLPWERPEIAAESGHDEAVWD
jgi:Asp-tRNA(Asn)/Glu-tRNA(Gln) amidotransferase A subunit family amidase